MPRTGVDCTPLRISEEKAARDRGLVELAGDMGQRRGWLRRIGAVESAQELLEESCRLLQGHSLPPPPFPLEHGVREEKPN